MASSTDRVLEDVFAEMFEALGATMAGFTEVTVEQMGYCTSCGCRVTTGGELLQVVHKWCFDVITQCGECYQKKGVDSNVGELCTQDEDEQVL